MAGIPYAIGATQGDADETKSHFLAYTTARTTANTILFDIWNAATNAGRKFTVDLDGKPYSAAWTAGDVLYAVAGSVTGVKRLDSLAIGTAGQVCHVNAGATAPAWTSTLAGLTSVTSAAFVGTLTGNVTGNVTGNLTGNVTGNASGSSGSCTGNAATATNATTAATATAVAASNGAVGTPSIAFSNSSTTGFYRAAEDIIGVAIAGVQLALFSAATATYFAKVGTTEYYMVLGTQVVGSQGAAVADATDAASVILRFNELAARCRAHGLIAS